MSDIEKNEIETENTEVEVEVTNEVSVDESESITVIEPETNDNDLVIEVKPEEIVEDNKGRKKNKKKKDNKNVDTEVVEVTNIPTEVVTTKETKKNKKFVSFVSFATIVLTLICSIVDLTLSNVTKDPVINLHLLQWIVIILYLIIATKALPFLQGKKKWVKALYWVCVIATLVLILVPMIIDYVNLSKLINDNKDTETVKNMITMVCSL